jgi:hemerythrin-like domain-containing protein
MDLTTNGVVITDAIKYVQGQMDHLNKQEKEILQDIKQENNETMEAEQEGEQEGEGEETTTNGVF